MSEIPTEGSITIPMEGSTKAFFQGVASGDEAATDLLTVPDHSYGERIRFFWLSVGTKLAGSGIAGDDQPSVTAFVQGAATRAPQPDKREQLLDALDRASESGDVDDFYTATYNLVAALRRGDL